MTKLREPLSFELALTRIAGLIGWKECGRITGKSENTVRNWSDPDTSSGITLGAALALDVAFQEAGGDGAPMWSCYSARLEADTTRVLFSTEAIAVATAEAAKESGEAISAAIAASRPGATDADRIVAEREIEESIIAKQKMLSKVRAGRAGERVGGTEHGNG